MTWEEAATPTTAESRKGRAPVRPGGLNGAKLNKTSAKTQTAAKAANNFVIPYDDAVKEGRAIVKQKDADERRHQMRLGELAARVVHPTYGDRTVAKFAKAIGIASCTLHRHRRVYKEWDGKGIVAPGPVSYGVLRALKDHPNRLEIVTENPKITQREALERMREHLGKPQKNKSGDWHRNWLRRAISAANDFKRIAEEVPRDNKEIDCHLREIVEPKLLTTLRDSIAAQLALADYLEQLDKQMEVAA